MLTTLTAQDVQDAYYAFQTRAQARNEETTPEDMIRELANTPQEERAGIEQFRRGEVLLKDYIVLMSDRSTAQPRFDASSTQRFVSPTVEVLSGHVATMEAYRIVALAQR